MATYTRGLTAPLQIILSLALVTVGMTQRAESFDRFADYDLVMYERPSLPTNPFRSEFPEGLLDLWLKALDRPDAELQRMVIDTLAIAHRKEMPGVERAKPRLVELLGEPDQRLDVVRALTQTLIVLDARDQAELLAAQAVKHGLSVSQIVEPALASWKSPAMQDAWLERVTEASSGRTLMTLACEGLGQLRTEQAAEPLRQVVINVAEDNQVRFSAARALGEIQRSGLTELAQQLVDTRSSPPELHALLATQVLQQHDDAATIEFLTSLVSHDSTTVQASALDRLYHIDINLVDRHAETIVNSPDSSVRRWCVRAMIAKQDVGRIGLISLLLDDVNPSLRREAANGLVGLAELPGFREEVIKSTSEVLAKESWRGCEQATVVLTKLDHKPAGKRFVELLGHQRGEVQVATAWGLTRLRIPELLPGMLEHAESIYEGFRARQLNDNMPGKSLHVAHLFIAFGDQEYEDAVPLMRKYLPKNFDIGVEARAAAAWAIGLIYLDNLQEDLAKIMEGRLNDSGGMEPEVDEVRLACALSLGRMRAEATLPSLRKNAVEGSVGGACYWSIERITGEPPPELRELVTVIEGWFLAPIREYEE